MFDFLKLKSALVGIGEHMAAMRSEKETLKRQREDLEVAPGTKADVIALFHARIDAEAAKYPVRLRQAIETSLSFGRDLHMGPEGIPQTGALSLARRSLSIPCSATDLEGSLFFFFGPTMKKAISDAINDMSWPVDAKPLAGRAALISDLDEKISKIEKSEEDLRREAAAAGVSV